MLDPKRGLKDYDTPTLKRRIEDLKRCADAGEISIASAVRAIHEIEDVLHERALFEQPEPTGPAHNNAVHEGRS